MELERPRGMILLRYGSLNQRLIYCPSFAQIGPGLAGPSDKNSEKFRHRIVIADFTSPRLGNRYNKNIEL
jgi:hypothetical protein